MNWPTAISHTFFDRNTDGDVDVDDDDNDDNDVTQGAWKATIPNGEVGVLCQSTKSVQLYFFSNYTGGPQLAPLRKFSQEMFVVLVTCSGDRKALVFKQDMDETSQTSTGRRPTFQWNDISESNCSFMKV
nr:hypothetical transcript [Hymenolepis microstoma]